MERDQKDLPYQKYLSVQLFKTDQLMLPHPFQVKAINHQSEQLSRHNPNNNIRLAIFQQFIQGEHTKSKEQKKHSFTRQSFSALNKKQRDIRKNNYHLAPHRPASKEGKLSNNSILVAKEASMSRASLKEKRPKSSASTRYLIQKDPRERLQRASTARLTRPSTSITKYSNASGTTSYQKQQQFRLQNPLVIYPFESHIKSKRIDDNPKILASIISKKHKIMEKEQLYDYVSKLMNRRAR